MSEFSDLLLSKTEEIEETLSEMTVPELNDLVSKIKMLTIFIGRQEIQKMLARKIAQLDERITVVERFPLGIKKSITAQDEQDGDDKKWPSINLENGE